MHIPELQELPPLPEDIKDAASKDELVVFVGAGISKLLGFPSWAEFAGIQLRFLAQKRFITYFELEEISKLDPKQQISIAYGIAKNKRQILNITETFKNPKIDCNIYDYIHSFCCSCVTTNYDKCLDPSKLIKGLNKSDPDENLSESSKLNPRRISKPEDLLSTHLKHFRSVMHLHGSIDDPENMIMTSEQYLTHYGKDIVKKFLQDLFRNYTVVFLGYGLSEVEILEQIFRSGDIGSSKQRGRYWLQGFFSSHHRIYEHQYRYFSDTFCVKILGFQKDYLNYYQQVEVLKGWAQDLKATPTLLAERQSHMSKILEG